MDAETRHELKTNDLGEALQNLPSLNDPRVRLIGAGVLVVILAIVALVVWRQRAEGAVTGAWDKIVAVQTGPREPGEGGPDPAVQLRDLIATAPTAMTEHAARLKLAHALLMDAAAPGADVEKLAREALSVLEAVASDAPIAVSGPALFLRAKAQENLGELDAAKATYQSLADPRFVGSPFQGRAAEQMASLDALRKPVAFVAGVSTREEFVGPPEPPPGETSAGQIITLPAAEADAASQPVATQPAESAGGG